MACRHAAFLIPLEALAHPFAAPPRQPTSVSSLSLPRFSRNPHSLFFHRESKAKLALGSHLSSRDQLSPERRSSITALPSLLKHRATAGSPPAHHSSSCTRLSLLLQRTVTTGPPLPQHRAATGSPPLLWHRAIIGSPLLSQRAATALLLL
ncbi:hypothetical protein BS78_10G067400 [Paspalum vaginatum]|nr:hypothetical protein BS78_10G067400 [Paspalum vaginatum]